MNAPTTRETADHAELLRRVLQDAQELSRRGLNPDVRLNAAEREAVTHLLSEIAALRGDLTETRVAADLLVSSVRADLRQAERQRDELRKALDRAADDLRDIGGQNPRPSNSPDPEHENYLRRVLISLAQVGNTRARQAIANQGADQ